MKTDEPNLIKKQTEENASKSTIENKNSTIMIHNTIFLQWKRRRIWENYEHP